MQFTTLRRTMACVLALACVTAASTARAQATAAPPRPVRTPAASAPAAATSGAPKPVAVIAISSYEKLLQDVDYIGSLVGMPGVSQIVEGQIGQMTGGKGLAGLDKTKPIGVLVDMSMIVPNFAAYLPVTDQAALLAVLAPFGITAQDMGNGITQINAMGQDTYAKTVGGWMLVGMSPDGLGSMPNDPSTIIGPLVSEYDVAVKINVQNLPEPMRQQGISAMSAAQGSMTKVPGESDADFAARKAAMQQQIDASSRMIRELDSLTLGLAISGEAKKVYLDANMTAVPGSAMATEFTDGASATTNFAGFAQPDAAAAMSFAGKVSGTNAAQIETSIANFRAKVNKSIDDQPSERQAPLREAVAEIVDAVLATVKAGTVDGGAVVQMAPNSGTIVVGGLIADPSKIESALKKLAAAFAEDTSEVMTPVSWNAETHGDVAFHTTKIKVADPEAQKLFGDQMDLVVGLGAHSAYAAWGRDAVTELKAVIDGNAKAPGAATKPMELTVTLSKIIDTMKTIVPEGDRAPLETMSGILASAGGEDHIHVLAQPVENGMQLRLEVEQGVLQAAGIAAMSAQAAQGPPAGP